MEFLCTSKLVGLIVLAVVIFARLFNHRGKLLIDRNIAHHRFIKRGKFWICLGGFFSCFNFAAHIIKRVKAVDIALLTGWSLLHVDPAIIAVERFRSANGAVEKRNIGVHLFNRSIWIGLIGSLRESCGRQNDREKREQDRTRREAFHVVFPH